MMVIQMENNNKPRGFSQPLWVNGQCLWVIDNGMPSAPLNIREKSKVTQGNVCINPFTALSTSQDVA